MTLEGMEVKGPFRNRRLLRAQLWHGALIEGKTASPSGQTSGAFFSSTVFNKEGSCLLSLKRLGVTVTHLAGFVFTMFPSPQEKAGMHTHHTSQALKPTVQLSFNVHFAIRKIWFKFKIQLSNFFFFFHFWVTHSVLDSPRFSAYAVVVVVGPMQIPWISEYFHPKLLLYLAGV